MDFAIFIPTYKRSKCQTLKYIPEKYKDCTYLVQRDNDFTLCELEHDLSVIRTPEEYYPISKTRHFIGEFCLTSGIKKFVMLDDDLHFYVRKPGVYNLRYCELEDMEDLFLWLQLSLDLYDHASISAREGNNRVYPETQVEVTRPMRVLGFDTEAYMSLDHGRMDVMEDFDLTLQLLKKGCPNLVSYHFAQGQGKSNDKGGCSEMRTLELQKENAYRLAELHEPFVKVREKLTKGEAWFGEGVARHDVTIQWKKAYKFGLDALCDTI